MRFPKTHKINELLTVLETVDAPLAKKLKKTTRLSKYAVNLRYPDAEKGQLTDRKVKAAFKIAAETYALITKALHIRR